MIVLRSWSEFRPNRFLIKKKKSRTFRDWRSPSVADHPESTPTRAQWVRAALIVRVISPLCLLHRTAWSAINVPLCNIMVIRRKYRPRNIEGHWQRDKNAGIANRWRLDWLKHKINDAPIGYYREITTVLCSAIVQHAKRPWLKYSNQGRILLEKQRTKPLSVYFFDLVALLQVHVKM